MKPSSTAPNTLLLGVYVQDGRAALLGTLRTADGALRTECVANVGQTWEVLAAALAEADVIGADHVVMLTPCADLVTALQRPFTPPAGAEHKRVWVAKGEYATGTLGGDPAHWAVLQWLGMHGGQWAIYAVDDLPKVRERWEQQ